MISAGDNCFALFIIVFYFLHHQCTNLQWKSEQSDESVSIVVIIHITGCEGCQRLVVLLHRLHISVWILRKPGSLHAVV